MVNEIKSRPVGLISHFTQKYYIKPNGFVSTPNIEKGASSIITFVYVANGELQSPDIIK